MHSSNEDPSVNFVRQYFLRHFKEDAFEPEIFLLERERLINFYSCKLDLD